MVTNPELPPDEPTNQEEIEAAVRYVIAGHPRGSIRRITLYAISVVSFVLTIAIGGTFGLVFGTIGIIALLLLGMSDQLA